MVVNRYSFQSCFQLPAFLPERAGRGFLGGLAWSSKSTVSADIKTKLCSQAPWPDPNQGTHKRERCKFTTSFSKRTLALWDESKDITIPKYFLKFQNEQKQPPQESMICLVLYLQERFPENQPTPFRKKYFFYLNTSTYHLIVAGTDCLVWQSSAKPSSTEWITETQTLRLTLTTAWPAPLSTIN